MEYELHKDKCELSFVFEGENSVDALTVTKALDGLITMVSVIAECEENETKYRLAVNAFSPGSFAIVLLAFAESVRSLLTPEGVGYAADLVGVIGACFSAKRFLKGKLPKSREVKEDYLIIENAEGATAKFPKGVNALFVDQRIDNSITCIINGAMLSDGVSGIRVDAQKKSVRIDKEEFSECAIPIEVENIDTKIFESTRLNEILFVRQPDLLGDSKWGFKSDKNLTADIADKDFLEKIKAGEYEIYSGMYVIADLAVRVMIGANGLPDEKSSKYTVTKIHHVSTRKDAQTSISQEL